MEENLVVNSKDNGFCLGTIGLIVEICFKDIKFPQGNYLTIIR